MNVRPGVVFTVGAVVGALCGFAVAWGGAAEVAANDQNAESDSELKDLRQEVERLRARSATPPAPPSRAPVQSEPENQPGPANPSPTAPLDDQANASAMAFLAAELKQQLGNGLVEQYYVKSPMAIAGPIISIWSFSGESERAYNVALKLNLLGFQLSELPYDAIKDSEQSAIHDLIDHLEEEGKNTQARVLNVAMLREDPGDSVQACMVAAQAADAGLAALDEFVARNRDDPKVAADIELSRAILMIGSATATNREAGWAAIDRLQAEGKIDTYLLGRLSRLDPITMTRRLEAQRQKAKGDVESSVLLAEARYMAGDKKTATAELASAVRSNPESSTALEALARIDFPKALELAEERASNSVSLDALKSYANLLRQAKRTEKALDVCERAWRMDSGAEPGSWHWRSLLHMDAKRYVYQVRECANARSPAYAAAMLVEVGDAFHTLGKKEDSIDAWMRARDLDPENEEALNRVQNVRKNRKPFN